MACRLRFVPCMVVSAACACSSDPATDALVPKQKDAGAREASVEVDSGADDAPQEISTEVRDAAPKASPVMVGLYPTALVLEDPIVQTNAVMVSLAAGADAVVFDRDWAGLPKAQSKEDWQTWETLGSYLNQQQKSMMFSLAVVNAINDVRPSHLREKAWGTATQQALHDTIDRIYGTFGPELSYFSLGIEVDVYMQAHPSQASSFAALMAEAIEYARKHPGSKATQVGITWSSKAWQSGAENSLRDELIDGSDLVFVSHYGVDEKGHASDPLQAVQKLRATLAATGRDSVVIHRVSYTTSTLLGGSESMQTDFLNALFSMVDQQRVKVPFVGVAMLNDPTPADCFAFAQARDSHLSTENYAYWCGIGLRNGQGKTKAGFSAFLSGVSKLSTR